MDLSQNIDREIWNLNENVQKMDKEFVKTNLFDENDRNRILEITDGDNYTYFIARQYAWLYQIGEYDRGDGGDESKKQQHWDDFNKRYLTEQYEQVKNYKENVLPIENFNPFDGGSLHPIEIAEAFNGRERVLDVLSKIPKLFLRNLKNEVRKPREFSEYHNSLPEKMSEINQNLKLIDRLSDDKKNIIFKKIFSSKNDTFDKVIDQLKRTNINYLSHEDAIEEVLDKIEYEADTNEAELLYQHGNIIVADVKSSDAMKNLGCGSQWCFATEYGVNHWANYADNSHVNIVYNFNEEADSPLRMVVILPYGSVYNMYNEYMDGTDNMSQMDGWYYLDSLGVADYVNANLAEDGIIDEDVNLDGDTFNPNEFSNLKSFAARKRYADKFLKRISSGSARIVYEIDPTKVLKLAKNPKGIAQNKEEIDKGKYDYYTQGIVTDVYEEDKENSTWLIAEKAKKINKARFKELTGVDIVELFTWLVHNDSQNNPRRYGGFVRPNVSEERNEELWENEFATRINDVMLNYDLAAGDLGKLSSFGEVIRDGQPDVVLIDYGFTHDVYKNFYEGVVRFNEAEDKSAEGIAKKMNAKLIYDKDNKPFFVRELGGHKDYFGVFDYDRGNFKQIGGVNYHEKDGKIIPLGVSIDDKYQKRGIGTALYKHIKDELGMNLQPSHNQTSAGKKLWQRVNEISDYMMNMYSNDDLEHVNDPNDKSDGAYSGAAITPDSESRGFNELGDVFEAETQLVDGVPKKFNVAARIFKGMEDENENLNEFFDSLSKQKLEGVVGISDNPKNVANWFELRDVMIIMDGKQTLELNDISKVEYDDPKLLVKDNFKIYKRLSDSRSDNNHHVLSNIFTYLYSYVIDKNLIKHGDEELSRFFSQLGNNVHRYADALENTHIKDFDDFVDKFIEVSKNKHGVDLNKKPLDSVLWSVIKKAGKTFSDEHEWIVNNKVLNIPQGSTVIFKDRKTGLYDKMYQKFGHEYESTKDLYQTYIDKYQLGNLYDFRFADAKKIYDYRLKIMNRDTAKSEKEFEEYKSGVSDNIKKEIRDKFIPILNDIVKEKEKNYDSYQYDGYYTEGSPYDTEEVKDIIYNDMVNYFMDVLDKVLHNDPVGMDFSNYLSTWDITSYTNEFSDQIKHKLEKFEDREFNEYDLEGIIREVTPNFEELYKKTMKDAKTKYDQERYGFKGYEIGEGISLPIGKLFSFGGSLNEVEDYTKINDNDISRVVKYIENIDKYLNKADLGKHISLLFRLYKVNVQNIDRILSFVDDPATYFNNLMKLQDEIKRIRGDVDESEDVIDEARREPAKNIKQDPINRLKTAVNKFESFGIGNKIFFSYRNDYNTTIINPNNTFTTPTGLYTYPYTNYMDEKLNQLFKRKFTDDSDAIDAITSLVPFVGHGGAKFLYIYEVKTLDGVLDKNYTINELKKYYDAIYKYLSNTPPVRRTEMQNGMHRVLSIFITENYNEIKLVSLFKEYINSSWNFYESSVSKLWAVLQSTFNKNQFRSFAVKIGINGFVDYGEGFIHPNEPVQAVIFRGNNFFEDVNIIALSKHERIKKEPKLDGDSIDKLPKEDRVAILRKRGKKIADGFYVYNGIIYNQSGIRTVRGLDYSKIKSPELRAKYFNTFLKPSNNKLVAVGHFQYANGKIALATLEDTSFLFIDGNGKPSVEGITEKDLADSGSYTTLKAVYYNQKFDKSGRNRFRSVKPIPNNSDIQMALEYSGNYIFIDNEGNPSTGELTFEDVKDLDDNFILTFLNTKAGEAKYSKVGPFKFANGNIAYAVTSDNSNVFINKEGKISIDGITRDDLNEMSDMSRATYFNQRVGKVTDIFDYVGKFQFANNTIARAKSWDEGNYFINLQGEPSINGISILNDFSRMSDSERALYFNQKFGEPRFARVGDFIIGNGKFAVAHDNMSLEDVIINQVGEIVEDGITDADIRSLFNDKLLAKYMNKKIGEDKFRSVYGFDYANDDIAGALTMDDEYVFINKNGQESIDGFTRNDLENLSPELTALYFNQKIGKKEYDLVFDFDFANGNTAQANKVDDDIAFINLQGEDAIESITEKDIKENMSWNQRAKYFNKKNGTNFNEVYAFDFAMGNIAMAIEGVNTIFINLQGEPSVEGITKKDLEQMTQQHRAAYLNQKIGEKKYSFVHTFDYGNGSIGFAELKNGNEVFVNLQGEPSIEGITHMDLDYMPDTGRAAYLNQKIGEKKYSFVQKFKLANGTLATATKQDYSNKVFVNKDGQESIKGITKEDINGWGDNTFRPDYFNQKLGKKVFDMVGPFIFANDTIAEARTSDLLPILINIQGEPSIEGITEEDVKLYFSDTQRAAYFNTKLGYGYTGNYHKVSFFNFANKTLAAATTTAGTVIFINQLGEPSIEGITEEDIDKFSERTRTGYYNQKLGESVYRYIDRFRYANKTIAFAEASDVKDSRFINKQGEPTIEGINQNIVDSFFEPSTRAAYYNQKFGKPIYDSVAYFNYGDDLAIAYDYNNKKNMRFINKQGEPSLAGFTESEVDNNLNYHERAMFYNQKLGYEVYESVYDFKYADDTIALADDINNEKFFINREGNPSIEGITKDEVLDMTAIRKAIYYNQKLGEKKYVGISKFEYGNNNIAYATYSDYENEEFIDINGNPSIEGISADEIAFGMTNDSRTAYFNQKAGDKKYMIVNAFDYAGGDIASAILSDGNITFINVNGEETVEGLTDENVEKLKQAKKDYDDPLYDVYLEMKNKNESINLTEDFRFNNLDYDKQEKIYDIFSQSYIKATGSAWNKNKFFSRAQNWLFYGDEEGFVAVRPQKSGLYKLVGVGGSLKGISDGMMELNAKNLPVWGVVSEKISKILRAKYGFTTPNKFLLKLILKAIPSSVYGGANVSQNKDGSINIDYSDVGTATKFFVANKAYYNKMKKDMFNKVGLFKDGLDYSHVDDATKDVFLIGEDGSSLYSTVRGTVNPNDQAPWLKEEVIPYDAENYDDEYDMDKYYEQAYQIAKDSNINILHGKNLSGFVLKDDVVVGAIFTEIDGHDMEYSFDVVVDKKYQNSGVGKELVQYGFDDYAMYKDMYEDGDQELVLKLDVVNPIMRGLLKKHHGLRDLEQVGPDRYLMGEEETIVPYTDLDDIVKELNAECFAIISGFVTDKSNNYNSKATELLHNKVLKPLNTKIIKMTGQWDANVLETSFFVLKPEDMDCDKFKDLMMKTAQTFKQESYLWSDNGDILINYTDGSVDDIGDDLNVTNSYVGFKFEGVDEDLVEMGLVSEQEQIKLHEESISRLWNHIQDKERGYFAIMSASRNELTGKENQEQTKKLSADLQREKAGHVNLIGHWEELRQDTGEKTPVKEMSFFIPKPESLDHNKFIDFIIELGEKYDQESVLIGIRGVAYEVFMNGGMRKRGTLTLQNIGKAYSSMRKKPDVTFVFEGYDEKDNLNEDYESDKRVKESITNFVDAIFNNYFYKNLDEILRNTIATSFNHKIKSLGVMPFDIENESSKFPNISKYGQIFNDEEFAMFGSNPISVYLYPDDDAAGGMYDRNMNAIEINYLPNHDDVPEFQGSDNEKINKYAEWYKNHLIRIKPQLRSTLIHELTHAYDFLINKFYGLRKSPNYGDYLSNVHGDIEMGKINPKDKKVVQKIEDTYRNLYFNNTFETNARFYELIDKFLNLDSVTNFHDFVMGLAKNEDSGFQSFFSYLKPNKKKRFIGRLYNFYTNFLKEKDANESVSESRYVLSREDYEGIEDSEIIDHRRIIDNIQRKIVRKEYFSDVDYDDIVYLYNAMFNNRNRYSKLWGEAAAEIAFGTLIKLMKKRNLLKEERIKSWMPNMTTPEIKKSCRLGGKSDGTSDDCSQGDTGVVKYKPLKDGHSHKPNTINVAEDEKWFDRKLTENENDYVPFAIAKANYYDKLLSMSRKKPKLIKDIITYGRNNGKITPRQDYFLKYWAKFGETPYKKGELPQKYTNPKDSINENDKNVFGYHVTRRKNLPSIKRNGLLPQVPEDYGDSGDIKGVYLFKSLNDTQTALYQWLGERIEEWEEENNENYGEVILKVDLSGLDLIDSVEYEWISTDIIEPNRIIDVLEDESSTWTNTLNEVGEANIQPYGMSITKHPNGLSATFVSDDGTKYSARSGFQEIDKKQLFDGNNYNPSDLDYIESLPNKLRTMAVSFTLKDLDIGNVARSKKTMTPPTAFPTTNKGDLFKIMSTIALFTKTAFFDAKKENGGVDALSYFTVKDKSGDTRRENLYKSFVERGVRNLGLQIDRVISDGDRVTYIFKDKLKTDGDKSDINEALPLQLGKKLTKQERPRLEALDKFFGDKNRLYFDFNGNPLEIDKRTKKIKTSVDSTSKNTVINELNKILSNYDFALEDSKFVKNVKTGQKVKLGKALNLIQKKGDQKLKDDIGRISKEINKINSAVGEDKYTKNEGYSIVISTHPYDIGGMSTDRDWSSCMSFEGGINCEYVYDDIKQGTIVAYVVRNDDTNIENPIARKLIKPYINKQDSSDYLYFPAQKIYGSFVDGFDNAAKIIADKINATYNPETKGVIYQLKKELYSDGDQQQVIKQNLDKMTPEEFEDMGGGSLANYFNLKYDTEKYKMVTQFNFANDTLAWAAIYDVKNNRSTSAFINKDGVESTEGLTFEEINEEALPSQRATYFNQKLKTDKYETILPFRGNITLAEIKGYSEKPSKFYINKKGEISTGGYSTFEELARSLVKADHRSLNITAYFNTLLKDDVYKLVKVIDNQPDANVYIAERNDGGYVFIDKNTGDITIGDVNINNIDSYTARAAYFNTKLNNIKFNSVGNNITSTIYWAVLNNNNQTRVLIDNEGNVTMGDVTFEDIKEETASSIWAAYYNTLLNRDDVVLVYYSHTDKGVYIMKLYDDTVYLIDKDGNKVTPDLGSIYDITSALRNYEYDYTYAAGYLNNKLNRDDIISAHYRDKDGSNLPHGYLLNIETKDGRYEYMKGNGEIVNADELEDNVTEEGYNPYINESMERKANIPTLQTLPFKDKIESLGGEIYSVGGAVRDSFLGKVSKDLDIVVTGIPEKELLELLNQFGTANLDGESFGVIKFRDKEMAKRGEEPIDIALPRKEISTGAGHKNFEVVVDHNLDIEEDLKRRDFTINAIAQDADGAIIDPFNGRQDLKDKVLRMTSKNSFIDDELRMLRGVQFASRFGFEIEPKTLRAIRKAAPTIGEVAKERWLMELEKIVEKGDPWTGLEWLKKTNLYEHMFGEEASHNRSDFNNINTMGEYIIMIIKDSQPNPREFVLKNLVGGKNSKLSEKSKLGKEVQALNWGFKNSDETKPARNRFTASQMIQAWPEIVNSEILPQPIDNAIDELKSGKYPLNSKELTANGHDFMQAGLKGQQIGEAQKKAIFAIYSDVIPNEKDAILKLVQSQVEVPDQEPLNEAVKQPVQQYGCLMVFPETPNWENIISKIKPEDVYQPENEVYGVEKEPHVTILYGFHENVSAEDFIPILSGISEPIEIKINGLSHFENEEFDVVKLDCESYALREIRKHVETLNHTKTYPHYNPHITLAYVKSGEGKKYNHKFNKPITIRGTKIVYSDNNRINNEMEIAQPIEPDKELL